MGRIRIEEVVEMMHLIYGIQSTMRIMGGRTEENIALFLKTLVSTEYSKKTTISRLS
jgi:hypothetical protein